MAAAKKRVVRKSVPTRGYSAKGRPSADTMERKAPKRKGMTADQRERMIKGAKGSVGTRLYGSPRGTGLYGAKKGRQADTVAAKLDRNMANTYTRIRSKMDGAKTSWGADSKYSDRGVTSRKDAYTYDWKNNARVAAASKAGAANRAVKKAAGAKAAAKKQNYR